MNTAETQQCPTTLVTNALLRYTLPDTRQKDRHVTGKNVLHRLSFGIGLMAALSACSTIGSLGFGGSESATTQAARTRGVENVAVNRYLWAASLDVLNFLPVESVDPFTGVIVMGFGTPPGSGTAYRATIAIIDPALDARSLNVSILTRSGPAAAETTRAIEDAILSRARQLRIADGLL